MSHTCCVTWRRTFNCTILEVPPGPLEPLRTGCSLLASVGSIPPCARFGCCVVAFCLVHKLSPNPDMLWQQDESLTQEHRRAMRGVAVALTVAIQARGWGMSTGHLIQRRSRCENRPSPLDIPQLERQVIWNASLANICGAKVCNGPLCTYCGLTSLLFDPRLMHPHIPKGVDSRA